MELRRPRPTTATRSIERLYRAHYGFVWQAVRRFGVVPPQTDDAVQDTFITAYRRYDEHAMPSAKAWLYGIARRIASNYRRADFRRVRRHAAVATSVSDPGERPASPEMIVVFDRFLAGLDPVDRELFVLSEIEGMTGPEAAHALALNTSTTYSRVQSLRRRFREAVAGREPHAVIAVVRDEQPRATAQGWALLLPELGVRAATTATVGSTFVKAASVAFGITIGATAASVMQPAAPTPSSSRAIAELVAAPATDDVDRRGANVIEAASLPAIAPVEPAIATPSVTPARASSPTVTRPAEPARSDSIDRDTRLVEQAMAQLHAGAADEALATTVQHAREFPKSALADARSALRIEALCALDKGEQARGEARILLRDHPRSPVRARIERSCAAAIVDSSATGQSQPR